MLWVFKVMLEVFFSKERTFLAWMHTAVLLAGASMAITAYSDVGEASALYGLMLMPIAIVFIVYAMVQCKKPKKRLILQLLYSEKVHNSHLSIVLTCRCETKLYDCNEITRTIRGSLWTRGARFIIYYFSPSTIHFQIDRNSSLKGVY